jgi:trimeric autotransporter adhesin
MNFGRSFRRVGALVLVMAGVGVSPALAARTTRIEQDDPRIVYSGNWYLNQNPFHSGEVATLTNSRGSRVTLSFTGTGIRWIGVADGWSGLATVHLDGELKIVDSYSAIGRQQYPLFTASGLANGQHTLTIEVTHERGPGTEGSWVWIDAFDIEDGEPIAPVTAVTTGRVEENHPALRFSGRWFPNANPAHSGGHAVLAMDAGSRVSVGFVGTGVAWVANRDEWSGVARIYVDGQLKTEIDTYLSPTRPATVPYNIIGLPSGEHVLTIEATGTHNQSAKGSWVWIDGFDVIP